MNVEDVLRFLTGRACDSLQIACRVAFLFLRPAVRPGIQAWGTRKRTNSGKKICLPPLEKFFSGT
ncbi:hypothetical protein [Variovorax paradoxus]|uniref:Uncharacterized protein n=1 Tax=Variovorax paradoxus TaxID=34073 RepID=A0A679JIY7_VARPD|nr:hypothetical protein VVAX_06773 [Variovorax paradoxus]